MSLKIGIGILLSLTLILFIYSAFFYEDDIIKKETVENEISQSNEIKEEVTENTIQQDEEVTDNSIQQDEEVAEVPKIAEEIRDGLFVVVGNQAVTKLDIVNEIKIILILNNISYSDEKRQELQEMAIKAIVKRTVKEIGYRTKKLAMHRF